MNLKKNKCQRTSNIWEEMWKVPAYYAQGFGFILGITHTALHIVY